MARSRFVYKFTSSGFDYFRDDTTMEMVKLPEGTPRTDRYMATHAIDAEDDLVVLDFYSEVE